MSRNLTALLMALLVGTGPGAMARESAQGPREAIAVHGHWVLEVRNPDGTLADRREFENDLLDVPNMLGQVLAQRLTMGRFMIVLSGTPSPFGNVNGNILQGLQGIILDKFADRPGTNAFKTLEEVEVPLGTRSIVLAGHAIAAQAGTIERVATNMSHCPPNIAPIDCKDHVNGGTFTASLVKNEAGVATPLPLVGGQIVQVKVTISFK